MLPPVNDRLDATVDIPVKELIHENASISTYHREGFQTGHLCGHSHLVYLVIWVSGTENGIENTTIELD
jgi:hypothetical protein